MSVTDLTGTTWMINSLYSDPPSTIWKSINFTSNSMSFNAITIYDDIDSEQTIAYRGAEEYPTIVYARSWEEEAYRTIVITGGSDVSDSTLISWLEANAIQVIEPYTPGNVYVDNTYLSNIANAIRAKNGLSVTYRPIEMGCAIDNLNLVGDVTTDMIAMRDFGSSTMGNANSIYSYAFAYCSNLTSISFPVCTSIGYDTFYNCRRLTSINFPACVSIDSYAFEDCYNLITANFPVCTYIGSSTFQRCSNLTSFYLTGSSLCSLANSSHFSLINLTIFKPNFCDSGSSP